MHALPHKGVADWNWCHVWLRSHFPSMITQPLVIPMLAAVASFVALVAILRRKGRDSASFPGPPRHWLLGNALDMPKSREWLTFAEWGRLYGTHLNDYRTDRGNNRYS